MKRKKKGQFLTPEEQDQRSRENRQRLKRQNRSTERARLPSATINQSSMCAPFPILQEIAIRSYFDVTIGTTPEAKASRGGPKPECIEPLKPGRSSRQRRTASCWKPTDIQAQPSPVDAHMPCRFHNGGCWPLRNWPSCRPLGEAS